MCDASNSKQTPVLNSAAMLMLSAFLSLDFATAQTTNTDTPAPGKKAKPELPQPRIVTPGVAGAPPSDAIVLFDGRSLGAWRGVKTNDAAWKVENGCMEVNGTGHIFTKEEFGDVQLHVEWATLRRSFSRRATHRGCGHRTTRWRPTAVRPRRR